MNDEIKETMKSPGWKEIVKMLKERIDTASDIRNMKADEVEDYWARAQAVALIEGWFLDLLELDLGQIELEEEKDELYLYNRLEKEPK